MEKKTYRKVITRDEDKMKEHPWYQKYNERKQEILSKYPPIKERTREEQRRYMKELGDVIFERNGPFQEFIWDAMSGAEKLQQERAAKGKQRGPNSQGFSYDSF